MLLSTASATACFGEKPNFIVILADDLGYGDLGCFGHPTIRTPHLDRLATEGVKLTSFYAQPVCTPSRAALLTGRQPARSGLIGVIFPEFECGLPSSEITLAEALKKEGYRTAAIGKWHLGHHTPDLLPTGQGFDEFFGLPYSNDMTPPWVPTDVPLQLLRNTKPVEQAVALETLTERYTQETIGLIRRWKREPFFIYLAHTMPHQPLAVSDRFRGHSQRGLYGDVVESIDWGVGEILAALKEEKLDRQTLVIFTSDNGPWLHMNQDGGSAGLLREGKGTTYEGGVRVPFVSRWPGQLPPGHVSAGISSTMDIYTTLISLAGGQIPTDRVVDGKNIFPLLQGKGGSPHNTFFYYMGRAVQAVREGKWKLRVTKAQGKETAELFDLDVDPSERFDLSASFPEEVVRLKSLIEKEQKDLVPGPATEAFIQDNRKMQRLYQPRGGVKVNPPEPRPK
ncbi:MAG: sulfatase [Acidobacteriota bacterium]